MSAFVAADVNPQTLKMRLKRVVDVDVARKSEDLVRNNDVEQPLTAVLINHTADAKGKHARPLHESAEGPLNLAAAVRADIAFNGLILEVVVKHLLDFHRLISSKHARREEQFQAGDVSNLLKAHLLAQGALSCLIALSLKGLAEGGKNLEEAIQGKVKDISNRVLEALCKPLPEQGIVPHVSKDFCARGMHLISVQRRGVGERLH